MPSAPTPPPTLSTQLRRLGLTRTATDLNDLLARAAKARWTPVALLEALATTELEDRAHRSLERRFKRARLGRFKPMADFDWAWPTLIEKDPIDRALSGALVKERGNLVLVAAQGLGKTMIARNIAHNAVLAGHSALFVEAAQMLLDLGSRDSSRALEHRLRHYARPDVLCIDEVGYLSYDARAADLLFQVISRRYQQKSVVITTNLAFKEWSTVFPSAACLVALIDRLTHHADIAAIEGESYRKREAEMACKARRAKRKPAKDAQP
jgi:DNA replication protein DnaC